MKLHLSPICLLLASTLAGCKGREGTSGGAVAVDERPKTAFSGTTAMGYVRQQLAFGPRAPGSPGHQQEGDWLVSEMRKRADTVIVQDWTHTTADGKKLALRNVLARFRPTATERVLYVTHWDTRPTSDDDVDPANKAKPIPGANDGASGPALFLALGDALKKTPPTVGVDLLFVDGEDYGDFATYNDSTPTPDVLIGSTYFVNHLPSPDYKPLYGVLWDMIGDRYLQLWQEANSAQQAPEVVTRVWDTAADLGYAKYFIPQAKIAITDDHIPFLKHGMHVIDVIDIDYCADGTVDCAPGSAQNLHHTQSDTIDRLSAGSLQVVGDVAFSLVTSK